jgi:hypothetical protein
LPGARNKISKTKPQRQIPPRQEGPETKPSVSRRHQRWRPLHWEGPRDKDLRTKRIPEEKVLKAKFCAPSEADKLCHRSRESSRSPKIKTSGRSRHLELEASGIKTCIG